MLKLLSKSIFVSVLCGSLMLMDFSYKGILINAAQAESVKTDKITDKDLMGTLTMTVVGTLATRLYTYKLTTDMMLAAAGGAAFIGGEVLAYFKLKEVMKEMEIQITRDKKGNINKEQIESLERLKKSYEEAKKTASTKKTLQMASAAAFAAAGIMAFTMAGVETAQLTACTATIPTVISAASASAAACSASAGACAPPFLACVASATALSSAITAYELKKQATGPSGPALAAYTASNTALAAQVTATGSACSASGGSAITAACNVKLSTDIIDSSGGVGLMVAKADPIIKKLLNENSELKQMYAANPVETKNKLQKLLTQSMEFVLPSARAELFSAMGIASSAAVAFLLYTQKSLGPTIDMYMLIPQNRAIVWGILAGLTFAATSATDNVIKQIDANISKIDTILNSMYQMAKGATGTQLAHNQAIQTTQKPNQRLEFNETDYGEVDLSKDKNGSLPCYTVSNPANCKSFSETVKDTPSFNSLNLESQKQLQSILATANGMNGTSKITSATLKSATGLAGNANALKATYDKAAKANAEALKKAGSKFNNDEQAKKLSGLIEKNVNDSLKKSKSNASGMLATMYGAGKGGITSGSGAGSEIAEKSKEAAPPQVATGGNVIDISSPGGKSDLGLSGLESSSNKEMSADELAALNANQAAASGTALDGYDLKNDISPDNSSSIFDLISNRYQRSAYPRLFKIKEPQPAAPVTK